MCSASMKISEIIVAANASATGRKGVKPTCQKTTTKTIAVRNSTAGYRPEMGCLQLRHFPPNNSQLRIGTLSYGFIATPQPGQAELGNTIDCSRGTRCITTFRKL